MKTDFITNQIGFIQFMHLEGCSLKFPIKILINYFDFGILYNINLIYLLKVLALHLNFNLNLRG